MAHFWHPDEAVAAVRSQFERADWARRPPYRPVEVTVAGAELVVRFRYEGHIELFAVRFSLDHMPQGPCTGELCQTVEEWAQEVDWTLDEELGTRMVQTAERMVDHDGVVTLLWGNGSRTR